MFKIKFVIFSIFLIIPFVKLKCLIRSNKEKDIIYKETVSPDLTKIETESLLLENELLSNTVYNELFKNHPVKRRKTYISTTVQSLNKNEKCYRQTTPRLMQFLKEHDINFSSKDVMNTEISAWQEQLERNRTSIHMAIILSVNSSISEKAITIKKSFMHEKCNFSLKANDNENANLTIRLNRPENEQHSTVEVYLEAFSGEKDFLKNDRTAASHGGIISQLFDKNKWKSRPMSLHKFKNRSTYFGLALALIASTLCGLSFVLKKRSLLKVDEVCTPYYLNRAWWMAHSLMVVGDILHYVSFYFAPALLVCIAQMMMVIVAAATSPRLLGEKIHKHWKLAFATSLGGCFVVIAHVPREPHIYRIETFLYMVNDRTFIAYNVLLLSVTIVMLYYFIPRWGEINSLAYTVQCAIFGSVAVLSLKGVVLVFTDRFFHWLTLTCLVIFSICLLLQLEYLNRALTIYNTLVVTTQYHVLYSVLVIMGSSLLFKVWRATSNEAIFVICLGFATTVLGVLIFAIFQEDDATFDFAKLFEGPEK